MTSPTDHVYRPGNRGLARREALTAAGGGLIALGLRANAPAAPAFQTSAIDVHHHFLPPAYKPLAKPWMDTFATGVDAVMAWTPERSLAAMAEGRVAHAILSISSPGTHFGNDADAVYVARDCNEYATQLASKHPGRFSHFAALPMPNVEGAIQEAERALKRGARGIGLLSNYAGRYLGDDVFAPLFDWLAQNPTVVYVHPTDAPCCTGLTPNIPTPLIEFPVDTARTISSLLWSGTLSRTANSRWIFSHGGGVMPMLLERVSAVGMMRRDLAAKVPEGPELALRRLYVDTASVAYPTALAALQRWLPNKQILFGTDFPWGLPSRTRSGLRRCELDERVLTAIELGNARQLFLTSLDQRREGRL